MRILVSAFACDPNRGSEPGIGFNFIRNLALEGHEVVCLTAPHNQIQVERALLDEGLVNIKMHYIKPAIFGHRAYKGEVQMYLYSLLWQHRAGTLAKKLAAYRAFDICHHITYGSIQQGSSLWRAGCPFVFGPVGGGQITPSTLTGFLGASLSQEKKRRVTSKLLILLNPYFRLAVKKASIIYVSNEETEIVAKENGARDVRYLADPALTSDWYLPEPVKTAPDGYVKILWVGRLMPRKGLLLSLEALARTRERNWHLTIVGDGAQAKEIDLAIRNLKLSDRVTRVGSVSYDSVKKYYRASDFFLSTPLRESVGVQLLEALASDVPILTLDIHGARLFLPDNAAVKVAVSSAEQTVLDLAKSIDILCKDPSELERLRGKGRATALNYLWPTKIRKIIDDYHSIISPFPGEPKGTDKNDAS